MATAPQAPTPFVLLSIIEVPASRRDEALGPLLDFVEATRAEPGCLAFELHEDMAQKGRFMVYEVFADDAAFEAHKRAPGLAPVKALLGACGATLVNRPHLMLSPWRLTRSAG